MKKYRFLFAALVSLVMIPLQVNSQNYNANYDESKIPSYELPDPLIFNNGKQVINAAQWMQQRRAEILEIFAQEMYGHIPTFPE